MRLELTHISIVIKFFFIFIIVVFWLNQRRVFSKGFINVLLLLKLLIEVRLL